LFAISLSFGGNGLGSLFLWSLDSFGSFLSLEILFCVCYFCLSGISIFFSSGGFTGFSCCLISGILLIIIESKSS